MPHPRHMSWATHSLIHKYLEPSPSLYNNWLGVNAQMTITYLLFPRQPPVGLKAAGHRRTAAAIDEKLQYCCKQESCAIAKTTAQCALHMGALKIFGTAWLRPRPLFPTFSWDFVPIDSMNVPTKFEVRSFTRSWDNRGYPKNLGSPWIRPRSTFS